MKKIFYIIFILNIIIVFKVYANQQVNQVKYNIDNSSSNKKNSKDIKKGKNSNINNNNNKNKNNKIIENNEFNLTESLMNFFSKNLDLKNTNSTNTSKINKKLDENIKKDNIKTIQSVEKIKQELENKDKDKELNELKLEKEQFDRLISVFTLSEFTTFEISKKNNEIVYYNVVKPCTLIFAFYLLDIDKLIHLTLSGPDGKGGKKTYKNFNYKNFLFYEHKAKYPGQYNIFFNNRNWDVITLSFAIKDDLEDKNIGTKKLDKISKYLNDIDTKVNQIRLKQNMINTKNDKHNNSVNKHNKDILVYSIIEVSTMILIFVGQLFYIKNKMDKI